MQMDNHHGVFDTCECYGSHNSGMVHIYRELWFIYNIVCWFIF